MLTLYQFIADEFTECQTLTLSIIPLNNATTYTGVPPYYLLAFEPGGIPTTTAVGSNPQNLTWQVAHKRGTP